MARARSEPAKWQAFFYEEADGARPALAYLNSIPRAPRETLYAIIVAVRNSPPYRFPTQSPMWSSMRNDKGGIDMSGIYEARDKHQNRLYRLFCVLDRKAPEHGVEASALVILSGDDKPVGTKMPKAVYERAITQSKRYLATSPRPVARPPL
jgi:hypothetical protein